jgi:hypothetical protein
MIIMIVLLIIVTRIMAVNMKWFNVMITMLVLSTGVILPAVVNMKTSFALVLAPVLLNIVILL